MCDPRAGPVTPRETEIDISRGPVRTTGRRWRVTEVLERAVLSTSVERHARWIRISHWVLTVSLLTLAFTGFVILMAHPRLYWGEAGNDLTPALLELPISRNYKHGGWDKPTQILQEAAGPISANRTYDIFNENGWGRSLHFLAAWWLVLPGAVYLLTGVLGGHFRAHVWPRAPDSRRRSSGANSSITCAFGFRGRAVVRSTACCRSARTRWSCLCWRR